MMSALALPIQFRQKLLATSLLSITLALSACSSGDQDDDAAFEIVLYETTMNQLDPLDKGGRWLANGIKETNELSSLEEE